MSRAKWIVVAVVAALVLGGVPGGYLLIQQRREEADRRAQRAAATAFAQAWTARKLASLTFAGATGAQVADSVATVTAGLTARKDDAPSAVSVVSVGSSGSTGGSARATLEVSWSTARDLTWKYRTTLPLVEQGSTWVPRFGPAVVHPDLQEGDKLRTVTTPAERGQIIGAGGKVLVSPRPVVVVGLTRNRAPDVDASAQAVADVTGIDAAALAKRVRAASPTTFVEAITLREEAYQEVRDRLQPVPGTTFVRKTLSLGPSSTFARALLGTVGPATAELVEKSRGRVRAGDTTGLSGLQRDYDEQLSGTPGVAVYLVKAPAPGTTEADASTMRLYGTDPVAGEPLRLTLDTRMQNAADAALTAAKKPAALVAIDVRNGNVLAVANGGPNASGYNRAFVGQYPPGSTFKVVSTLALLGEGLEPDTVVDCPATLTVSGKTFSNAEDEVLGAAPFHRDFADSCNTAFVGSSRKITAKQLAEAATALGYGRENALGTTAFTGSVPTSGDAVAHAAATIGQGKVLASPVTVAGASAAVAAGRWHAPRLVVAFASDQGQDQTVDGDRPEASPTGGAAEGDPLPEGADKTLRSLMREVVTNGTGTGLRSVAGGPVYGKTGTAEYGSESPPRTHAWFTGFQGDVAFAVVVEDGGFGAESAVPLVARFLNRIN